MADPIRIDIDDREVLAALRRLLDAARDLDPALNSIGEHLVESTRRRFETGTAPDGSKWPVNSQATYEHYLYLISGKYGKTGKRGGTKKGYLLKDGRASAQSAGMLAAKRPLHGISGSLAQEFYHHLIPGGVEVGSPMKYAAMQQFGGTKARWPQLWGDIPARPFLGLSDDDRRTVLEILRDHLETAA